MAEPTGQNQSQEVQPHESARQKRDQPKPNMQPPLTPMIDVTFQLLLFFLLTMTFRPPEGIIPSSLPAAGTLVDEDPVKLDPIEISVTPAGVAAAYEMSGRGMVAITSPAELFNALKNRQETYGTDADDVPVKIKPDPGVQWQYVVEAFNQALRAKFKNISFASD